ncbi:MAG: hypothetical protein KDC34_03130 [Saprospiraceae bacterium]|nr:hypothetical protein [Saprospiraceae bacterium]
MGLQLVRSLPIFWLCLLLVACQDNNGTGNTETLDMDSIISGDNTPCQLDSLPEDGNLYRSNATHRIAGIFEATDEGVTARRLLEVYETLNCILVDRVLLPPNSSPDYPYYLAEINYNQSSQILGIRGFDQIFFYDMQHEELLGPISPVFKNPRNMVDAQSGMIQHMELWEHYLIGYCQDQGTFVFDLSYPTAPSSVLPMAEYKQDAGNFAQLFLIPTVPAGHYQLLLPKKLDGNGLVANPLLKMPLPLKTEITEGAQNNQYIILREKDNKAIAIDMKAGSLVELSNELSSATNAQILDFLRSR